MLGPPQVAGDGGLPRRESVVLCALVVSHGRVVAADQLAEAVWGDAEPSSWANQVQICVTHLRRRLPAGAIETVGGGYRLRLEGDEVDAYAFERLVAKARDLLAEDQADRAVATLRRALELWRGAPFEELGHWEPGSSEAARLDEVRLSAEEELIEARLRLGDHRGVAADVEPMVARQPLRERRWALLALALYRCGRQADALRAIGRARRMLAEQLGIDPGPELVAMEAAILRQDPTLDAAPARDVTSACPYKGLAAYDADDVGVFFGRAADIAACMERLDTVSLLVVAGPSGCGKSSLVRAGVVPALHRRGRAVAVCVPGNDADAAITTALAPAGRDAVLVVDQFEELFADPERAPAVLGRLAGLAAETTVVICVRADFLSGLSLDREFARLAERGVFLVGPLGDEGLRQAIEGPAGEAGLRLERGLVDLLVRDTEGQPGALPLLSHALVETWRRREGTTLTVEGYRATGGIRGAVARSADQLYDSLPIEQRAVLRSLVLRLVSPTLEGDPVRSRVAAATVAGDRAREHVIGLLVRARLVTAAADSYELAHEALARAWPRLQAWLEDDAAGQRMLRHLGTAAAEWDTLGRPDSELYRGARLDATREWRTASQPELTSIEAEFLDASDMRNTTEQEALRARADRDARQNRRLRRGVALVAALAVAALVAGVLAVVGQQRADTARATSARQSLVRAAVAERGNRRDLAALLAVEAQRLAPSAQSEDALFGLFTTFPGLGRSGTFLDGALADGTYVILPDGVTLVGADPNQVIRFVDLTSGHDVAHLGEPVNEEWTAWTALTPDGRFLAVDYAIYNPLPDGGFDRRTQVSVWDLQTRSAVFERAGVPFATGSVAISADGTLVAVAGEDEGKIALLDGRTGMALRNIESLPRPEDAVYRVNTVALAFTHDGRLIVTSQAGPIRIVDPRRGAELARIDGLPQTSESAISISADERWMITIGAFGVERYDLQSMQPAWQAPFPHACQSGWGLVEQVGLFLCGENGGRLTSIDVTTGGATTRSFESLSGGVGAAIVSGDGSTLVVMNRNGFTMWRTDGSSLVNRVVQHTGKARVAGYTADGTRLLVQTLEPNGVEVVDAATGAVVDRIPDVLEVHPTSDPQRIVARFGDGTIGWYDLADRARVGAGLPGLGVVGIVPTASGALGVGQNFQLVEIDLAAGTVHREQTAEPGVVLLDVAPDGTVFGGTTDGTVQRRDPADLSVEATSDDVPLRAVVAGNDRLVLSSNDGEHYLVDARTMRTVSHLPPTRGWFADMALDISGRRLLALGADDELRLYDLDARVQIGGGIPLPFDDADLHNDGHAVAFRSDGFEAAAIVDGGIAIWDLDPDHWITAACTVASRNLTQQEWATYIGTLAPYHRTCPQFP